jgi:hypothetical protein
MPNRFPKGLVAGSSLSVDPVNGSDSAGARGGKSFLTLAGAKAVAVSGDTIIVWPGTYNENNLLKDGVDWFFMPGAVVDYTVPQHAKVTVNPSGANNGLVFTANTRGTVNNGIIIHYTDDGSQVADTAAVTWNSATRILTVKVKNGTTRAATVQTAVNAGTGTHGLICGLLSGETGLGTVADTVGDCTLAGGTGTLTSTSYYGIFDDRDGAVTCTIDGKGTFIARDNVTNLDLIPTGPKGLVYITSGSTIRMRAAAINTEAYISDVHVALYCRDTGKCFFEVDEILDLNVGTTHSDESSFGDGSSTITAGGVGMFWTTGEVYLKFGRCVQGTYGIWAGGPDAPTLTDDGNLWVEGDFLQGNPGPGLYYSEGVDPAWRTWIHVKHIDCVDATGTNNNNSIAGGRHYLKADKVSGSGTALLLGKYLTNVPDVLD